MKYLLGVDFGGGSTKATVIDTTGNIVAENVVEYQTYYPQLGWCEQSPEEWYPKYKKWKRTKTRNIKGNK